MGASLARVVYHHIFSNKKKRRSNRHLKRSGWVEVGGGEG